MKHDALLKARKETLDDFLTEGDEAYDTALKAIDLFLDYLEEDNIKEIIVTSTGSVPLEEITTTEEYE